MDMPPIRSKRARESNETLDKAFQAAGIKNRFHLRQLDARVLAKRWTSLLGAQDDLAEVLLNELARNPGKWDQRLDELVKNPTVTCNPKWMARLLEKSKMTEGHDERVEDVIDDLTMRFWFQDHTQEERESALESLVVLTDGKPAEWNRTRGSGGLAHTAVFAMDAEQSESAGWEKEEWLSNNMNLGRDLMVGLKQIGVDLEEVNEEGLTPLQVACELHETERTADLAIHSLLNAGIGLSGINLTYLPLSARGVFETNPAWRSRTLGKIAEHSIASSHVEAPAPRRKRHF